jgi:hypothetical protein
MPKVKWTIAAAGLAVVGVAVCLLMAALRPAVRIVNESTQTMEQVECILSADGVTWTERVDEIGPGRAVEFPKDTSDLYVSSLQFRCGDVHHKWEEGGIACPHETFILHVGNDGEVSTSYSFWRE